MGEVDNKIASGVKPGGSRARATGKSSLADVARQAGVSTATVSRVLNSPEKVAEKSRQAVKDAIERLGYIPDGAARALASRHSSIVGAVVPTLDNALFAEGIQCFQRRLKQLGYALIVASHEYDPGEEVAEVKILLRQGVDALLLVGSHHDPGLLQLLEEKAVPFVNCWAYDPASKHPHIGFDNRKAARRMTEHLLSLGHVEFAVIIGRTRNNDRARERLEGIRQAIRTHGLTLRENRILQRSYSVRQGRHAMRQLIGSDSLPTAVLCGNDILALGAVAECQSAGIDVPGQVSITGFDDLDMSSQLNPALTTVRVRSAEMGQRAAEYLIGRIRQEVAADSLEIECELMIRETTARAHRVAITRGQKRVGGSQPLFGCLPDGQGDR